MAPSALGDAKHVRPERLTLAHVAELDGPHYEQISVARGIEDGVRKRLLRSVYLEIALDALRSRDLAAFAIKMAFDPFCHCSVSVRAHDVKCNERVALERQRGLFVVWLWIPRDQADPFHGQAWARP